MCSRKIILRTILCTQATRTSHTKPKNPDRKKQMPYHTMTHFRSCTSNRAVASIHHIEVRPQRFKKKIVYSSAHWQYKLCNMYINSPTWQATWNVSLSGIKSSMKYWAKKKNMSPLSLSPPPKLISFQTNKADQGKKKKELNYRKYPRS